MSAPPVDEPDEHDLTHLEKMLDLLTTFNVEYTLVQDEAGATVEVVGGDRGTLGFSGLILTYNFAPVSEEATSERFLFMGVARA
jgi:hypothetical protein